MKDLIRDITNRHMALTESLDSALAPFAKIRVKEAEAPPRAEELVRPLLAWLQQGLRPHLVIEDDLLRPYAGPSDVGDDAIFNRVFTEHDQLRKLANEARQEINLLLQESSIREAWWDTMELSAVWALRREWASHIDFEHRRVLPRAAALTRLPNQS